MKPALCSLCCALALGCGAAEPSDAGQAGAPATSAGSSGGPAGGAGASTGGASGAGGASAAGASTAGSPAGGANGGSASGGSAGALAAGTGGLAGASGAGGGSACTPNPTGALSVMGDSVHDGKTCLDWSKTTKPGVNYAAAEAFCADSTVGGFDDWRIPTASEFASIVTRCGKYAPEGPIDTQVFDLQGDGYWTTTPAGEPNKVCAVGMLNAGGYYHYGTAGPQVVRCVRGAGTVKPIKDCTLAQGCTDW